MSSDDEGSAQRHPFGLIAQSETDSELMAVLSQAAMRIRLEWNPPPCPKRLWLDYWFLLPFFPEVHREGTKSSKAPFYCPKLLPSLLHPHYL